MNRIHLPIAIAIFAGTCHAQLTPDQKLLDFQQLVALYDKNYAPYEWKRDALGFDMLKIAPWMDRVRQTKNDIEFYEVSAAYVAALTDSHAVYRLPSTFYAYLGFDVDLYDGKPLVEYMDPFLAFQFPFRVGDELISVDGVTVANWMKEIGKYRASANPRTNDRYNVDYVTFRPQSVYPRATEVGEKATVVIKRRTTGALETYEIPWDKVGLPLGVVGPVPSPQMTPLRKRRAQSSEIEGEATPPEVEPEYMKPLRQLQNFHVPEDEKGVQNYGSISPVFRGGLPTNFTQRLGRLSTDYFFSGVYQASGRRIGFLRIPRFDPTSTTAALVQLQTELAFLQANTDALVVDIMRNPGGLLCYGEDILKRLIPYRFRGLGVEIRATRSWLNSAHNSVEAAEAAGASQFVINQYRAIENELDAAYRANRGRTNAVPLCASYFERDPATTTAGTPLTYTKPMLLLTDEFSASTADVFAAIFQDSQRGPIFGWRTMGAGGSVSSLGDAQFYSEATATVTESLAQRTEQKISPQYGITPYLENVGVVPDIQVDYMTEDNLLNQGRAFVDAFTAAVVALIK